MELAVRPDEVQRASLRALQDAIAREASCVRRTAPTYKPITPMVRIDAMEQTARQHAARDQYRATCSAKILWLMNRKSASIGSRRCCGVVGRRFCDWRPCGAHLQRAEGAFRPARRQRPRRVLLARTATAE